MILIIANARRKGGLSGSDNIYEALGKAEQKYWLWSMLEIDFRPFWLCYLCRIILGCWWAIKDFKAKPEFVYSASDFLMDSLPAFIYKLKGCKWVAGFYLFAPKNNKIYYYSQKIAYWLIKKYADVVCVTNESMFDAFCGKGVIAIHGGVDLSKTKQSDKKDYDAVFVGRFHYTKGIKELTQIWDLVVRSKPDAKLAVIGAGDTEAPYFTEWFYSNPKMNTNIFWFGYLGDERFDIYAKSKMVLYTTPEKYAHFSMGPVEAMACGCPMIAFNTSVMQLFEALHGLKGCALIHNDNINVFAFAIQDYLKRRWKVKSKEAIEWAQTWDWSKRAPKILERIRWYLK